MRLVALADSDVLGALPITDPQFLPLVLKVELLRLARGALGRLRMVIELQVLLLIHILHFLVAHERSRPVASVSRIGGSCRVLVGAMCLE